MSDERKKPKSWFWFKAGIIAATFLYPLSFGPVCWMVGMGWLPAKLAGVCYYPVAGIFMHSGIFFPQFMDAVLHLNTIATDGFFELSLSVGLLHGG